MAKKKGFGKHSPSEFRRHLNELEALLGQKNLASKLGVSPATLRRYKSKDTLPPDFVTKTNRAYGSYSKRLAKPETQAIIQKAEAKRQKLVAASKERKLKQIRRIIDIDTWMDTTQYHLPLKRQKQILEFARRYKLKYAAFLVEEPREAQFLTEEQFLLSPPGKPPNVKSVYLLGTVIHYPYYDENQAISVLRRDVLSYFNQEWDLQNAMQKTRDFYFQEVEQKGTNKRNPDHPEEFISYFYL